MANALAAAAAALALRADPAEVLAGLEEVEPVAGRLGVFAGRDGARLLDDTYNANPGAVKAALDTLVTLPAPRWCLLGAMGELGEMSAHWHAEVGRTRGHWASIFSALSVRRRGRPAVPSVKEGAILTTERR